MNTNPEEQAKWYLHWKPGCSPLESGALTEGLTGVLEIYPEHDIIVITRFNANDELVNQRQIPVANLAYWERQHR